MFRQSIDPKGGFPPRSGKKKKSKKKKPIKRRKKTRDPFSRERQQERAFKFGEVRSGLSGRSIYNPEQFIRFHQTAQFNQQRDEAEKTRRGGTFTGTSIGEEAKVREAQEVDRRFKERQLGVQERLVGAVEKFIDKANQPQPQTEVLQELRNIRQEVIEAKKPTSIPTINLSRESSLGEADIEDITSPIPESSGGISDRRKPEDSLEIADAEADRQKIQERRRGFLSQGRAGGGSTLLTSAPRPDINNPSQTPLIKLDSVGEVVKGKSIFSEPSPLLTTQTQSAVLPELDLSATEEDIPDLETVEEATETPRDTPTTEEGRTTTPQFEEARKGLAKTISEKEPEPEPEPVFEKEEVGQLPEVKEEDKLFAISNFGKLQQETGNLYREGETNKTGYTLTNPEYSFIDVEGKLGTLANNGKVAGRKYQVIKVKGDSYQYVGADQEGLRGWSTIKKDRLEKLIREGKVDFNE